MCAPMQSNNIAYRILAVKRSDMKWIARKAVYKARGYFGMFVHGLPLPLLFSSIKQFQIQLHRSAKAISNNFFCVKRLELAASTVECIGPVWRGHGQDLVQMSSCINVLVLLCCTHRSSQMSTKLETCLSGRENVLRLTQNSPLRWLLCRYLPRHLKHSESLLRTKSATREYIDSHETSKTICGWWR